MTRITDRLRETFRDEVRTRYGYRVVFTDEDFVGCWLVHGEEVFVSPLLTYMEMDDLEGYLQAIAVPVAASPRRRGARQGRKLTVVKDAGAVSVPRSSG